MSDSPSHQPCELLAILNPAAGNGHAQALEDPVREWLTRRGTGRLEITHSPAETSAAAGSAGCAGVIVVVGGDGTVGAAVNGLMGLPRRDRPRLAVVPAGSGNDFARLTGVTRDPVAALDGVLASPAPPMDVGVCNGRYFINAVSIGLDARVAERATELKQTTGRSGLGLYLSAVGPALLHDLHAVDVRVSWDGQGPREQTVTLIAVTNGTTYGGGFRVAPQAAPDDGLLDTVIADEMGLAEAAWRLPAFVLGRHTKMRPVHMGRCRSGTVESAVDLPAQMDGEVFRASRFEFAVIAGALDVHRSGAGGPRV